MSRGESLIGFKDTLTILFITFLGSMRVNRRDCSCGAADDSLVS